MAGTRRTQRINSLLKEVLSDVVRGDVKHPDLCESLISISSVEISNDFRFAKVYISVIGDEKEKIKVLHALKSASGFIGRTASKMVVMHHFPTLNFFIDESVDKQIRIQEAIERVNLERESRLEEVSGNE